MGKTPQCDAIFFSSRRGGGGGRGAAGGRRQRAAGRRVCEAWRGGAAELAARRLHKRQVAERVEWQGAAGGGAASDDVELKQRGGATICSRFVDPGSF